MRLARRGNLERKDLSRVAADQRRKIREKMKLLRLARLWRLNFVWRWSLEPRTYDGSLDLWNSATSKCQWVKVLNDVIYVDC